MAVPLYHTIIEDSENFFYKDIFITRNNSKNVGIQKSLNQTITPQYQLVSKDEMPMRAPFGISHGTEKNKPSDPNRLTLELTLESPELLKVLQDLDQKNIQTAQKNSVKWFDKEYLPIVKFNKDPIKRAKYKPTIRVKVNMDRTKNNRTKFFILAKDENSKLNYVEKDPSIIVPGCSVIPIVKISNIWLGLNFGCTIDLTDCIVFPPPKREGCPFQVDDLPVMEDSMIYSMPGSSSTSSSTTVASSESSTSVAKTGPPVVYQKHEDEDEDENDYVPPSGPMH